MPPFTQQAPAEIVVHRENDAEKVTHIHDEGKIRGLDSSVFLNDFTYLFPTNDHSSLFIDFSLSISFFFHVSFVFLLLEASGNK